VTRFFRPAGTLSVSWLVLLALLAWAFALEWRDRPPLSALGWPVATAAPGDATGKVSVTWLGITTLLFDDGETQVLTDGTFTRLSPFDVVSGRAVWSDAARVNAVIAEYGLNRLAAIVPLHTHFDHAMDLGLVANRTTAIVLGSESAANIARGGNVPVAQYQILADGESRRFGEFTITLIESAHAPIGPGEDHWFAGRIEEPLVQPASVADWKSGISWSVLIAHPQGTALVQGSAGFVGGKLAGRSADVAFLSVAGLTDAGREHAAAYWSETVGHTGARRVFPIHFDDFTRPFGELRLFPAMIDDVTVSARWLDQLAGPEGVAIERLPLGVPVVLYP
jgi:L-ascorbate metabolism protein UlaG (beta-lactamase superfamily)